MELASAQAKKNLMFCLELEASTTRSDANKSICSFNPVDFSRARRSAHQDRGVRSDFFRVPQEVSKLTSFWH